MSQLDRRVFAKLGAAAPFLNLNLNALGANEKVTVALIGARNQGAGVASRFITAGAEIKTLCDIDDAINAKVNPRLAAAQERPPEYVKDFRYVLDDKSIDAVIIATPDHWHTHMALLACQAGKDVFLEKPVSQTIEEGRLIRDAARKYRRVMQVGTMRRSAGHFRTAAEYVGSGKLGRICMIKAWVCQKRRSIGNPPDGEAPADVDYDKWLGPAPLRNFNPNHFHYNWRFFWNYGNTELGNMGVHLLDIALWGIQEMRGSIHRCLPTRVSSHSGIYWLKDAKEIPDTQVVNYDYGDFLLSFELRSFNSAQEVDGLSQGTSFYGSDGTLTVGGNGWRVHGKDGEPGPSAKAEPFRHEADFLDCIKSRKKPSADIEIGRLSTTLCHLGNISHRLGREIHFDPNTETFGNDAEANRLLRKSYRAGYELPSV